MYGGDEIFNLFDSGSAGVGECVQTASATVVHPGTKQNGSLKKDVKLRGAYTVCAWTDQQLGSLYFSLLLSASLCFSLLLSALYRVKNTVTCNEH